MRVVTDRLISTTVSGVSIARRNGKSMKAKIEIEITIDGEISASDKDCLEKGILESIPACFDPGNDRWIAFYDSSTIEIIGM